jgi:hypothetical protein
MSTLLKIMLCLLQSIFVVIYKHYFSFWGSVVVKALRYKSEGPGIDSCIAGVFSVASDSSMCPGVDSASKSEYQVNPGGKGGLCVRLTTYHLHVPMSRNLGAITSWNPVGLFRPVMEQLLLFLQEYAVTRLVEALSYKPEGLGFDSRWCHWNFSST